MTSYQGYFYIIPTQLAESGDFYKAMLFGLIVSLGRRDSGCTASNKYLATKLNKANAQYVSKLISELRNEGWIRVQIDQKNGNRRKITPIMVEPNTSYTTAQDPYYTTTQQSSISNSNINSNIYTSIFEKWNSFQGILPTHRLLDNSKKTKIRNLINKGVTEQEILTAISNYAKILGNQTLYWFSYKWTLTEFLSRGFEKFADWEVCSKNYSKENGNKFNKTINVNKPTPGKYENL